MVLVAAGMTLESHTLQWATAQDCATHRSPAPSDASNLGIALATDRTRAYAGLVDAPGVLLPFRYRARPEGTRSPPTPICQPHGSPTRLDCS